MSIDICAYISFPSLNMLDSAKQFALRRVLVFS